MSVWESVWENLFVAMILKSAPASTGAPIFYPSFGNLPFSQALQVGDMLYLSCQIGAAPSENNLVAGEIKPQDRQTIKNINAILKRLNLVFRDAVKCTVMHRDMADWPAFYDIGLGYFANRRYPLGSSFGPNGLAYKGAMELECGAYYPQRHPHHRQNRRN